MLVHIGRDRGAVRIERYVAVVPLEILGLNGDGGLVIRIGKPLQVGSRGPVLVLAELAHGRPSAVRIAIGERHQVVDVRRRAVDQIDFGNGRCLGGSGKGKAVVLVRRRASDLVLLLYMITGEGLPLLGVQLDPGLVVIGAGKHPGRWNRAFTRGGNDGIGLQGKRLFPAPEHIEIVVPRNEIRSHVVIHQFADVETIRRVGKLGGNNAAAGKILVAGHDGRIRIDLRLLGGHRRILGAGSHQQRRKDYQI